MSTALPSLAWREAGTYSIHTEARAFSGITFCHGVSVAVHFTILLSMMLLRRETRQSSIIKKVDNPIYGKDRYNMMHHF